MAEDDEDNDGITDEQLEPFLQASGTRVGVFIPLPKHMQTATVDRGEPGVCTIVDSQPPLGRAASLKMSKQNGWMIVKDFALKKEGRKNNAYKTWVKSAQCGVQNNCIYRVDTNLKGPNEVVLFPAIFARTRTHRHTHTHTHTRYIPRKRLVTISSC